MTRPSPRTKLRKHGCLLRGRVREIRLHTRGRHGARSVGERARLGAKSVLALDDDPGVHELSERPGRLVLREPRALRDARDSRLPKHDGRENAQPLRVGEMAEEACW